MSEEICQSCSQPLDDDVIGENPDYCKYCFADGKFTGDESITVEQMAELGARSDWGYDGQPSYEDKLTELLRFLPTLKRWKK